MDIKVMNILKVVDIFHEELHPDVVLWLQKNGEATYRDNLLREHLYNSDMLEELEQHTIVPPMVKETLLNLQIICAANDSGYFRIVFS